MAAGGHDREHGHSDPWDDEPLETGQLELADADERLPWLESPEDEDWDQADGGGARLLGLALAGLVVLALAVGGIWWLTHRAAAPTALADGSIIRAPAQPYKEAPRNPGGKTFAGTGDASFVASEGKTLAARLGGPAETAPAPAAAAPAAAAPAAAASAAPRPVGIGVQVGAYSSTRLAEAGWSKLVAQADEVLAGVPHRIVSGNADIGTVYRLQAVAPDAPAAAALCGRLKAAGIACQVK